MQHFLNFMNGYLKIRVKGAYVERFLNMCSFHKIDLWNLISVKHDYEMFIKVSDFKRIKSMIKKTKSKVVILERFGFPFFMAKFRKRTVFLICFSLILISLYGSTFFLSEIKLSGNQIYTDEEIKETLYLQKIHAGVRKEKINCESINHLLRTKYEKITWVSSYIDGTKLNIRIKENNKADITERETDTSGVITSNYQGEIIDIITRAGTPLVKIGDEVEVGDILVSGKIEIKNDAGEVSECRYVTPDADIGIKTVINYYDTVEYMYKKISVTGKASIRLVVDWNGRRYVLPWMDFKKFDDYTKEYIQLFHSSILKTGYFISREFTEETHFYTKGECETLLNKHFLEFCNDLEKKGVQILQNDVKIYSESECSFAKGTLTIYVRNTEIE